VDGVMRLAESNTNQPVNIGNPTEITIGELAREIIAETGSSSRIVFKELPVDDPKVRKPDITLARKLLGWEPQVSFGTGLQLTIAYFREKLDFEERRS